MKSTTYWPLGSGCQHLLTRGKRERPLSAAPPGVTPAQIPWCMALPGFGMRSWGPEALLYIRLTQKSRKGASMALCSIWDVCRVAGLYWGLLECALGVFDPACLSGLLVLTASQTSVYGKVTGSLARSQILTQICGGALESAFRQALTVTPHFEERGFICSGMIPFPWHLPFISLALDELWTLLRASPGHFGSGDVALHMPGFLGNIHSFCAVLWVGSGRWQ